LLLRDQRLARVAICGHRLEVSARRPPARAAILASRPDAGADVEHAIARRRTREPRW